MHRVAWAVIALLGLSAPPTVAQQKRQPKDLVLHQYLIEEFGKLSAQLTQLQAQLSQLGDKVNALETEITRIKQQQSDLRQQQTEVGNEVRATQTIIKTTDTSLTSLRLSSQQDLACPVPSRRDSWVAEAASE